MANIDEAYNLIKPTIKECDISRTILFGNHKVNSHCPICERLSTKTITSNDGNCTQIYECGHRIDYGIMCTYL
jgi:hypothetical protein